MRVSPPPSSINCLWILSGRSTRSEVPRLDWQWVLFEPTKAQVAPFRTTFNGAVSYIVAGDADFAEDHGFALAPLQPCALRECMHDEVEPIAHGDEGYYFFADMHSHGSRPMQTQR